VTCLLAAPRVQYNYCSLARVIDGRLKRYWLAHAMQSAAISDFVKRSLDAGAVEFRQLTASIVHGVEVVD